MCDLRPYPGPRPECRKRRRDRDRGRVHEPDARELPAALLARSTVVVEDPGTARREAGDVVMAVAEGALAPRISWPCAASSPAPFRGLEDISLGPCPL